MTGPLKTAAFAVLGATLPIRYTSRLYLAQQLERYGAGGLPRGAIQELANDAVLLAQAIAQMRGKPWRDGVAEWLEGQAVAVAYLLHDDRDAAGRQLVSDEQREKLVAILTKHGVTVPQIDTLKGH